VSSRHSGSFRTRSLGILVAVAFSPVIQAQAPETFSAVATVSKGSDKATATLTVVLERLSTEAERTDLMAALKKGGTSAARDVLAKRATIGTVQLGTQRTPVKYAFARSMGAGRLLTVVTAQPIAIAGSGLPDMTPKAGYDLGLVLLEAPASGQGQGELSPAAKVRVDDKGAIVTEDSSAGTLIRLSGIVKK
jgi:hypothetical protein